MEITNKTQLLEFIRQQSLKLLKENGAFATLEDKLQDLDDGFVQVNEKRFERLRAEEDKAITSDDYAELERIKQEKVTVLGKLIASYQKKVELLGQIQDGIKQEMEELKVKGNKVFRDKPISEFNNEDFQKGNSVKITSLSAELKLEKITDNNNYSVLHSTAPGVQSGDIIALPSFKIGGSAELTVYRKMGERWTEVGRTKLENVKAITKNPS